MLSSAAAGAHGGTRARAQTLGHAGAHLDLGGGARLGQRLRIGIGDHELAPVEVLVDHVVDGIAARATRRRTR
jgi:hypothetical protein